MQPPAQNAVGILPVELLLIVLDELTGTRHGQLPAAYALPPSDSVTKTLRALTLVSRTAYRYASQYLYTHCLYLDTNTKYSLFRRTLGLDVENHPLALDYGQAGRSALFDEHRIQSRVTSLFISPARTERCGMAPRIRLPQVVDLCLTVGSTLKRLAIDFAPVYVSHSEQVQSKPSNSHIFLHMPCLEELVCSFDTPDYFRYPPPNLKRLAMTANDLEASHLDFIFMVSSLETVFLIRPAYLGSLHIDRLFRRYKGRHVDIVFVDVNNNHRTPRNTRDWTREDRVTIWEADVPTSFYGDEEDLILCDAWMWSNGVQGTLWTQNKRKMLSWSEVERRLAEQQAP